MDDEPDDSGPDESLAHCTALLAERAWDEAARAADALAERGRTAEAVEAFRAVAAACLRAGDLDRAYSSAQAGARLALDSDQSGLIRDALTVLREVVPPAGGPRRARLRRGGLPGTRDG